MPTEKDLFLSNIARPLPQQHYLASPYTTGDAATRADYAEASRQAGVRLRQQGYLVYCPLLAGSHELPSGWYHYDLGHLRDCHAGLLILTLPGWEKSFGIQLEIAAALALEREITMLSPEGLVEPALLDRINQNRKTPHGIHINEQGVASVVSNKPEPVTVKDVTTRFAAGSTVEQTAQELNLTTQQVYDAIRYQLS